MENELMVKMFEMFTRFIDKQNELANNQIDVLKLEQTKLRIEIEGLRNPK